MGEAVAFSVPAPARGDAFVDPRDPARVLRIAWHPEGQVLVLSVWRRERCVATHRVPAGEVGRLIAALLDGLATPPAARTAADPMPE
jgi:hypothetical protein